MLHATLSTGQNTIWEDRVDVTPKMPQQVLDWLQREKCSGRIIPDHVLHWLEQEKIKVSEIDFILDRMSEQQVCNYLQRQKSGTRDSLRQIISTWRDYLSMADKLIDEILAP